MKPRCRNQRHRAFTLVEMLVVIILVAVLAAMILPASTGGPRKAKKIYCMNNLKQIGLVYKNWEGDHNDKLPFETSVTNGGTMELNYGANAWINFLVMSNELVTPRTLLCPADDQRWPPATNFSSQLSGHVSYFVGLGTEADPQALRSGDDNFEISGMPVKPGWLELPTTAPISWTAARHNRTGNILLVDGSVQATTSGSLHGWLLPATGLATNRLAIP